ncbi:hypothetical protein BLNAU_20522 [Blattamonas nauphoetae]|uniref:Uncharacterized protein n=1 Tax=Blattamonas nauphoetae TaxID=2049346 RepID=A0ABQ9WZ28_9EUKA|nr:hypothetical protein BLNAU_20522 [Blattamonas nauphoetae]
MLEVTVDEGWDMNVVNTTIDKCRAIGSLVHFVVWKTVNISSIQIRSGHVTSTDTHNTHLLWIECKSPQNLPLSVDDGLDYAILHLQDLNMTSSYCEQPSSDTSQVRICGGFVKFDVGEKWTVNFQNGILKRLYPNTNNSFGTVLVNFTSLLSDFSFKGLEFDECATARGQKIGFIFQESVPRNLKQKLQVKYQYEQRQYFEYQISGSDRIHSLQYVQALTPWHIALLSLAFLVALPVVLNFLFCFPSLPVLFCFRKRYSSKPQRLSTKPAQIYRGWQKNFPEVPCRVDRDVSSNLLHFTFSILKPSIFDNR